MGNNPYKTRNGGATVTVFVPYDCINNCPFCVNKEEYQNMDGFSVEKICRSIDLMNSITPDCDFVFTGGEPFANLGSLQTMLDHVPVTHKVYINTTFPVFEYCSEEEMLDFVERNKEKITCINISRHLRHYVQESPDELIARIPVPTRVNCVLYNNYPKEELLNYVKRFEKYNIPIQFRFDYTATTPENLYDEKTDKILTDLKSQFKYTGLDGCRMRCGYHFKYNDLEMTYHKTLPYSTIVEKDGDTTYDILYDILIKQNGDIHGDWDGKVLDIDKYKAVTYEPYDLKWIERIEAQ